MKLRQYAKAFFWWALSLLWISSLWQGLEIKLYGAVQPRDVDSIITVAWSVIAWCAYGLGRIHGQEGDEKE